MSGIQELKQGINTALRSEMGNAVSEIRKLNSETLRVGKEIGSMQATIESLDWIKPLLSLVKGEGSLEDHQVRVIGLRVLNALSSRLNEIHGQDYNLYQMKAYISNSISELERWKT